MRRLSPTPFRCKPFTLLLLMVSDSQLLSTETDSLPDEIQLTLLLSGGQEYQVAIEPDNPLLQQLYETLLDGESKGSHRLFQIPIHQGQAVLAFPSSRLVGLVTEPPLIVQPPVAPEQTEPPEPSKIDSDRYNPLISHHIQIDQFLTPDEHQQLLQYVMEREAKFESTRTSTGAAEYRRSVVLYSFPEFSQLMTQRVQAVVPDILDKLGLPRFPIEQIEAQLTGHNDGNFYKIHNDNGSPDTATRELTYVYYFYREPKSFTGGELVIYDSKIENNYYVKGDTSKIVEPRNNSIVFFLSRYMHEVLPVNCPSRRFEDSRFTINGWVRRAS